MKADCYRPLDEVGHGPESPDFAINLAIIYEDPLTQEWAGQVCDVVTAFIDRGCLASHSWRVGDLAAPKVLHDAVCAAAQADVIVLSLRDAEELPLTLRIWIEAWLPRRDLPVGALITLIGAAEGSKAFSLHARRYLEAVARSARMDLLLEERRSESVSPQVGGSQRDCGHADDMFPSLDDSFGRESRADNSGGNQGLMTHLNS